LQQLSDLPMTDGLSDLQLRAGALSHWKKSLQKGVLPDAKNIPFPDEKFSRFFLGALKELEMARFTRRHPQLLDTLLKQMLTLVKDYEEKLLAAQAEAESQKPENPPPQPQQDSNASTEGGEGEQQESGEGGSMQEEEMTEQQMKEAIENAAKQQGIERNKTEQELQLQLEQSEGSQGSEAQEDNADGAAQDASDMAASIAEEVIDKFKEDWEEAMENLDTADAAFDNLEDLMEGPKGFDLSRSLWKMTGWKEMERLRRKLEDLKELRELVRQLGRGGGRGPRRRAPREVEASRKPPGMVRSPLQPEETSGLARSGDLSLMLPVEMSLIAKGWPRVNSLSTMDLADSSTDEELATLGSRGARLLHMARRAERNLLSYERSGWLEDVPSRVTDHFEIRPAAEQGPIIVCLDTSGSMRGRRETVAKALAVECMRGAHRQQRKCYLYAFSGPGEVNEFELKLEPSSLEKLLKFLSNSFEGGTDVDAPLIRSLEQLGREEWSQADILMVTDGEIRPPGEEVEKRLKEAVDDLGLEVHGVIVGNSVTKVMEDLCTHLHVFKSWTAVGER